MSSLKFILVICANFTKTSKLGAWEPFSIKLSVVLLIPRLSANKIIL